MTTKKTLLGLRKAVTAELGARERPAKPVRATIALKPREVQIMAVRADDAQIRVKWPDGTVEALNIEEIESLT